MWWFFEDLEKNQDALGYIAVSGAILFFGSFAVPLKTRRVQEAQVDPVVFQMYYSLSIFCSSFLVLTYNPWVFTPWGIAGAALWVPASILSIFAINYLGLSIAVGVWAGTTIVISFLWGALAFPKDDAVKNIPLSVLALFLLVSGIVCLSLSNSEFVKKLGKNKETKQNINEEDDRYEDSPLLTQKSQEDKSSNSGKLIGLACSLILGCLNGSMMVPLRFVPKEAQGINYIVSFGIGVLIVTPVCAIVYFLARRRIPVFHYRIALIPGLITGLLWNIGNFCSIYATLYLGLTIGFPLTQLALVVSGLWGLLVFKELRGIIVILVWFASVIVLLSGAALLSLYV